MHGQRTVRSFTSPRISIYIRIKKEGERKKEGCKRRETNGGGYLPRSRKAGKREGG